MLGEYYDHTNDKDFVMSLYSTLIQPAANFMADFMDPQTKLPHASYDLWEQKFQTSTYTTAVVYQSLLVAGDFAEEFDYPDDAVRWRDVAAEILENSKVFFDPDRKAFRKGYLLQEDGSLAFDNTLDVSSFYGPMMYWPQDMNEEIKQSLETIENTLLDKTSSGGCVRYEHDGYFMVDHNSLGNPWIIATLWLGQYYIRTQQLDRAKHYVDWAISHAEHSGMLSEQVNPNNGYAIGVSPLVWSHAELVNTILDLTRIKH
jgi:GH15 family glucan-1,4-alpha-glucosidase